MGKKYERIFACVEAIRQKTDFIPETALVLGSGLGDFGNRIDIKLEIPYSSLPGFPVSTVTGHAGKFLLGYVSNEPVIVMQGRVHYYEGYSMEDVVLPIRVMGALGAKRIILTNAAGGINLKFNPGDFMMLSDHISTFVPSPLIGENEDGLGPRFPDMSAVYDAELRACIRRASEESGVSVHEGVYVQCSGPQYESPAEIRMLRTLGADAVGMSTVCEAIAARHMGLKVCAVSCITNMASGILPKPLDHTEVQRVANEVKGSFELLMLKALEEIHKL